ncbi:protein-L-isoaspartate O-methyltransferase family protein [Profundibacterium mesophilum]|uniref:Protein-L-isoaspartate O-methyltransferase n=1 Tax=Profundibacterium mesophilum KAUST100406-0324 TaxID=1037889 RepID=A0A921NXY7_9RHOB|nr:protein-L-isoaspartate O-methyltransferase [Profundibacterium mesophilum]KAF0676779.1 Protein-L-isoaspartate O-methyltransferase [Profundibacterium mesophilum KAUST100406-0324]
MIDFAHRRTVMVDTQVRPSDVTKFPIIDAMLQVPRERFVPDAKREAAYMGGNLEIGEGRWMLEPRTLSKMLDALNAGPDDLVLDVAAGQGYAAAILSRLAQAVVALEEVPQLAREAESILGEEGADNVAVVTGDLREGAADLGPFDVILIEGGIEVLPEALEAQLAERGRIAAIFMDGDLGTVRIGRKLGGVISWRDGFNAGAPVLGGFERKSEFAL